MKELVPRQRVYRANGKRGKQKRKEPSVCVCCSWLVKHANISARNYRPAPTEASTLEKKISVTGFPLDINVGNSISQPLIQTRPRL